MTARSARDGTVPGIRPVVVGVDGSDGALEAVEWAALEAHRHAAPLRLVTAFAWEPGPGHPGLREHYRTELLERAREHLLGVAVAVAERAAPGLRVSAEVVVGFPIATLHERSHRARLLVLGSRGLGGVAGLLVGSVTVALTTRAGCPVVVVGDRHPTNGPVVVGVDGSHGSDAAIAFAHESAAARGTPLIAVHTWTDTEFAPAGPPELDWHAILDQERLVLAERLARWSAEYPGLEVRGTVGRHGAAAALVRRSEEAQLVVVGSRGHGNLAGMLHGSVSHAVLHRSHCPVAVVHPEATRRTARG